MLQRELVLPRLVQSFGLSDYAGAKDDTITVRAPAILAARDYEWRTRSAPIVVDDIVESSIPVTLGSTVKVTQVRGRPVESDLVDFVVPTVHPSSILRVPPERRTEAEDAFVGDLRAAAALL